MTLRRHTTRALLGAALIVSCLPGTASAACPPGVRADSVATQAIVADLVTRQAPGAEDARWLYERARRSCADIRPARAIAQATSRLGVPPVGRRARVHRVELIGLAQADGTVAWRLDLARIATRSARGRNAARSEARNLLGAAAWGSAARTWSADPTRLAWDPGTQSAIVAILGRSSYGADRDAARRGARAFAVAARTAALARRPLLQHLHIANRLSAGTPAADPATARVVRSVALRTFVRVRAARSAGWSRIDGEWAAPAAHRALVRDARRLLATHPHAPTAAIVTRLQASLRTAPAVRFETLPAEPFYPWPRDGAFDSRAVTVEVDKPARVRVLVYAAEGTVIRAIDAIAEPGLVTITWDGSRSDGTIVEAGEYRYNVEAHDLVGNRVRLPGLDEFAVARDSAAPAIVAGSLRIVGGGSTRRAIAAWDVDEVHSPVVRSWLVLRGDAGSRSIILHDRLQAATVRRALDVPPGTWTATMVFIDGSGNRIQRGLGPFQVR